MPDASPSTHCTLDHGLQQTARQRIARLVADLTEGLVERDVPVRLGLLAALAGEHILLVGPPGTAKSEIASLRSFVDATFFERLMTRFSVPEELFGPLSLQGLERDEYTRLTEGYLPTASVAFLDEVFKANSAILNSLLTILNEREFDNGLARVSVPLISMIGAANEIPTAPELLALYDRFLLRYQLDPVSKEGFEDLLRLPTNAPRPSVREPLELEFIHQIREHSRTIPVASGVLQALVSLRAWLMDASFYVSDRRWLQIMRLMQVAAYTEGRSMVLWPDCWLVLHCVWSRPEQATIVQRWFDSRLIEIVRAEPARYDRLVGSLEAFVSDPNASKVQRHDRAGRPL
ncbi:MAG: AAA family ATPase, partial [Myxococcales bacterium]|nr:AAA family ATPase [Myxococcales bacterium]